MTYQLEYYDYVHPSMERTLGDSQWVRLWATSFDTLSEAAFDLWVNIDPHDQHSWRVVNLETGEVFDYDRLATGFVVSLKYQPFGKSNWMKEGF